MVEGVVTPLVYPSIFLAVSLLNSLQSKSMHAIYGGTLRQGEQMYKINIRAVCAPTRAMIPEWHKSGQRVATRGRPDIPLAPPTRVAYGSQVF